MNQNLTVLCVFLRTLKIMIDAKRLENSSDQSDNWELGNYQTSYNRPDATVKILMSACFFANSVDSDLFGLKNDETLQKKVRCTQLSEAL